MDGFSLYLVIFPHHRHESIKMPVIPTDIFKETVTKFVLCKLLTVDLTVDLNVDDNVIQVVFISQEINAK